MAREVVQRVKNAVLYSDGLIRLDRIRFSYPHVKKAYSGDDGGEAKYGIKALLPKATHKAARRLCMDQIDLILTTNKVKAIPADKKFCRDGDETGKEEEEGMWTVSARETKRPSLRDGKGVRVEPEEADDYFVGGYWGSVLIRPWWQNHKKFGKRVNAGLVMVQYWREDEPFGEGRISDEELDDMTETYDDNDESYEDDEEEERPRRKRRVADDDAPPRRSRRRSHDDDDEDEPPRRRRRSRDDDDDDIDI